MAIGMSSAVAVRAVVGCCKFAALFLVYLLYSYCCGWLRPTVVFLLCNFRWHQNSFLWFKVGRLCCIHGRQHSLQCERFFSKHNLKSNHFLLGLRFNPLIATLKPQSNGPSYSNTVIGTLAVDAWAVTFGTATGDWAGPQPAQASPRCTKCNSPPSTASVPTSSYSMWHYNCL